MFRLTTWGRGDANGLPGTPRKTARVGGPAARTRTPTTERVACHPAAAGCAQADLSRNAGSIPGVGIFHENSYLTVQNNPRAARGRHDHRGPRSGHQGQWGANGAIDSVFDMTHQVPVPFSTKVRASWGHSERLVVHPRWHQHGDGAGYEHIAHLDRRVLRAPIPAFITRCGGAAQSPAVLQSTPG